MNRIGHGGGCLCSRKIVHYDPEFVEIGLKAIQLLRLASKGEQERCDSDHHGNDLEDPDDVDLLRLFHAIPL